MRVVRLLLAVLTATMVLTQAALAADPVDLLLVLASDVSRSVDAVKFKLQRDGYIAPSAPARIEAIRSGPQGRIAICLGMVELRAKVVIDGW
jgi:hypothetical protein